MSCPARSTRATRRSAARSSTGVTLRNMPFSTVALSFDYAPLCQRAAIQIGSFGDIAPRHGWCTELLVTCVYPARNFVAVSRVGNNITADAMKLLEQIVVEPGYPDGVILAKLAERGRVVGVELGQ